MYQVYGDVISHFKKIIKLVKVGMRTEKMGTRLVGNLIIYLQKP